MPVLLGYHLRRWPDLVRVVGVAAAGAVGLVLVLSLVRPYWGEAPERPTAIPMPRATDSQGVAPGGPPTTSAEQPAGGRAVEPAGSTEDPGDRRASATPASGGRQGASASRGKAELAPPGQPAALPRRPRDGMGALTRESQNRPGPLAGAPPAEPVGGAPFSADASRAPLELGRSSPPPAASLATPGSAGQTQVASPATPAAAGKARVASEVSGLETSEVSALENGPAMAAGEVRVFIHHVADQQADAALARELADHLQRQGFLVADIRPVEFRIGKPSVRYFFRDDRDASERLVDELGRFFQEESRAPDQASDFTHFWPKPRPGNVEVWLSTS